MVHRIPSYCSSRLLSSGIYLQIYTFLFRPFNLQECSQSISYTCPCSQESLLLIVKSSSDCPRRQWNRINNILHRKLSSLLPSYVSLSVLASQFATLLKEKITQLRLTLSTSRPRASHCTPPLIPPSDFSILPEDEILKVILDRPDKT